jgi:site-specific recombinase XerD
VIRYCQEKEGLPAEKITLDILSNKLIISFLEWLENERKCSVSTRNQRLAAIHSFFRFIQSEEPTGIFHFQKIMAIPIKKAEKNAVEHLTPGAMKLLLEQPDRHTRKDRRDLTLISILYDTGARVQELIDIRVGDVILENPAVIILTGKGKKKEEFRS